ncbi:transketolase [Candidatus Dependentiae bacterium]|nr:transketolase [Candidatus Dependentiae bacterium]
MNDIKSLEHKAYNLRKLSLMATTKAGSGHPTSALSAADIVAALFFNVMKYDPKNHENPNNDRFILSKGHASPVLYAAWEQAGVISEKELMTLRQFNSVLEGHPTTRFKYIEAATGSLGMGLSIGLGIYLASKLNKRDFYTYVLIGDAELQEGQNWEAVEVASFYKAERLIAIVDANRLGQSCETIDDHHMNQYKAKFEAFGWNCIVIDGHNMQEIVDAFEKAKKNKRKPTAIVAKTYKGYGLPSNIQDKQGFHGKAFSEKELPELLKHLKNRFNEAANYENGKWKPNLPTRSSKLEERSRKMEKITQKTKEIDIRWPKEMIKEETPTRKAYGIALKEIGKVNENIVSLDGDVKNSTFAEIFEKEFPKRFFQCFVAEQNMVSMAVGMATRGKIPFVSTFASFFSRAHDQIRMAAINKSPLRLVGSHVGVSIGQDGPSQMGLEDIATMRALVDSVVLYPCDAISTLKLVQEMANYDKGISYLRTTREKTPILYETKDKFVIGGCRILKQSHKANMDKVCIITAGITIFQALKAYSELKKKDINISIIDCYSIKPLDKKTLISVIKKSNGKAVTVEDHYIQGGLGEAVCSELINERFKIEKLAVTKIPKSGKPEELLAYEEIDHKAIIKTVLKLTKS